jgi:hypothetical protein
MAGTKKSGPPPAAPPEAETVEYRPGFEQRPSLNDAQELPPPSAGAGTVDPGPCPITILGSQGNRYAFLTPRRAWRVVEARGFSAPAIADIFEGRIDWLWKRFPRRNSEGEVKGWSHNAAYEWLINESARRPQFDAAQDLRGLGVWFEEGDRDVADHCVIHCGDRLWVNLPEDQGGGYVEPGLYRGVVYPALRPGPRPADAPSTVQEARDLLDLFKSWSWLRPDIDPVLLIGWVAAALVCGALDWRPSLWITGDRSTGKSTLQNLIRRVIGPALLQLSNTTEAAVRGALSGSARPVELDEFEAEEVNTRRQQVVQLIRIGSTRSGGKIARGSADGGVVFFNIDAVFLCSSILRPPLPPQDLQRFTLLDLNELRTNPGATRKVKARSRLFSGIGPRLLRRIMDRWDDLQGALEMFGGAFVAAGHTTRAADQMGTLLALADIVLNDDAATADSVAAWVDLLGIERVNANVSDENDAAQCLRYLLTASLPAYNSGRHIIVARVIAQAIRDDSVTGDAQVLLMDYGLKIDVIRDLEKRTSEKCLAVALNHGGLARLFEGSRWGTSGGMVGPWSTSLRRLPGTPQGSKNVRIHGVQCKSVLIPVWALDLSVSSANDDEAAGEAAQAAGGDPMEIAPPTAGGAATAG